MRTNKFVIMADGKHEHIYYTGREGKYWAGNIMRAKAYNSEEIAQKKCDDFKFNNARVVEIMVKETVI